MDKKRKIFTADEAFLKMARICSQKECAPFDISMKLRRMGIPEKMIDRVIKQLVKGNYLDEKRYIRSFIHDKIHFNRWGRRKIELSLSQKKLPQAMVDEVFLEFADNDSSSKPLQELLKKKWETVKGRSDYEKRGKLMKYALGRGFTMDEVMVAMEKIQSDVTT